MATQYKIIPVRDFIEITTDGTINLATSTQLIIDIARSEYHQTMHELLVDFRDTECNLSVVDVYQLTSELCRHGNFFCKKIALLVLPGLNFDRAKFFETCSFNRGFSINAYTDYETALRWILEA